VRGRSIGLAGVVALTLLTPLTSGCSGSVDRSAAVDDVLTRFEGRLTRSQAECYVDRVVEELGADTLEQDRPPPEKVPRLTRIRTDCAGVASLGTSIPPSTIESVTGGGTAPMKVGADPELDALHAACAEGAGEACDRLFDLAPLGSEYEDFALSCGGRTSELRCAARYPGGEVRSG
jgi:hypothetical protein